MSHAHQTPTNRPESSDDENSSSQQDVLVGDQFERLAELVANGQIPFSGDLAPADAQRLVGAVSRRRRRRLVRYVARCIALDLLSATGHSASSEEEPHASKQL